MRGQGVKVTSVVSRVCAERDTKIPDLKKLPNLREYIKMVRNGNKNKDDVGVLGGLNRKCDERKKAKYCSHFFFITFSTCFPRS